MLLGYATEDTAVYSQVQQSRNYGQIKVLSTSTGPANEECLQCQETLIVNQATYSSTHVWVEAVLPVVANSLDT
jgi:hypothetical protein